MSLGTVEHSVLSVFLRNSKFEYDCTEIVDLTDHTSELVYRALCNLVKAGKIVEHRPGRYSLPSLLIKPVWVSDYNYLVK
jgi:hypothetical protein